MARPPVIKSLPLAIMANGRTTASVIRDSTSLLRRNVEILKQLDPADAAERAAIEEYLNDPTVNPMAEKKSEEVPEPKPLSERDKKIAKLVRHLQESDEEEVDMHLRFLQATKRTAGPKTPARGSERPDAALAGTGSNPGTGKAVAQKT